MQQIVECVPNFSDGRRPEVYNAIADAVRNVPGARVLGVDADADHNRTVITFVGSPEAVEEGAYQAITTAAQLINLDEHEGEHPRIGATDVCPFIPVKGVTMKECVAIAKRVGERVGSEGIAVYLYEAAATRPERQKLSKIRKGQYEKWKEEVATNPDREPDYGPAAPQPWGATVIGARPFLIAYNIFLDTDDVEIATKIAKAVRYLSGGLRYVQGLGFMVEGQAQVSMNLTNFEKTPIYRVQEMVKREAERYGVKATKAELVGMIPQKALMDSAKWYLQLDDIQDDQILEYKMAEPEENPTLADVIPHGFLAQAASKNPTPGGGSVAALAGALGAALVTMVTGLTLGRKKYKDVEKDVEAIRAEAVEIQALLTQAIVDDSKAYDQVMAAFRNRSVSKEERAIAIEAATIVAGETPLRVAKLCLDVAYLAETIVEIGNKNAVTDAATAGVLARAAIEAAGMNVLINATGLQNQNLALGWKQEVDSLEQEIYQIVQRIKQKAKERGGF